MLTLCASGALAQQAAGDKPGTGSTPAQAAEETDTEKMEQTEIDARQEGTRRSPATGTEATATGGRVDTSPDSTGSGDADPDATDAAAAGTDATATGSTRTDATATRDMGEPPGPMLLALILLRRAAEGSLGLEPPAR